MRNSPFYCSIRNWILSLDSFTSLETNSHLVNTANLGLILWVAEMYKKDKYKVILKNLLGFQLHNRIFPAVG